MHSSMQATGEQFHGHSYYLGLSLSHYCTIFNIVILRSAVTGNKIIMVHCHGS